MDTPWCDHCHDTLILVLSAAASALTPTGAGTYYNMCDTEVTSSKVHNLHKHTCMLRYTLQWKIHCHCYTLPPVFSSSGHHSDGVVSVTLEVSESGLSCCWVADVQGGPITSLRTVGHSGGVEAVGS